MAIPTDYIFTSGTCNKNQIYQLIIEQLVGAGWTDVSSNPATDFVVLKSPGNTGDKSLILNIRPTNAAAANSVVTTDYCVMSYRLEDTYTPGTAGVAGTFGRSALAWTALYLVPVTAITVTLGADTQVNYKVYADASKLILVLEYPNSTGYGPIVIYLGRPDSIYVSEAASRGVVAAISTTSPGGASALQICNTSDGVASVVTPYALTTYALLPPGDPNNSNKRMISPIYYGSATEGFRGQLDGLKCIFYANILTGDTITDENGNIYYVVVAAVQGTTSFPSRALLVRIS